MKKMFFALVPLFAVLAVVWKISGVSSSGDTIASGFAHKLVNFIGYLGEHQDLWGNLVVWFENVTETFADITANADWSEASMLEILNIIAQYTVALFNAIISLLTALVNIVTYLLWLIVSTLRFIFTGNPVGIT